MMPDINRGCVVRESEKIIFVVAVYSIVLCVLIFFCAVGYIIYLKVKDVDCSKDPVVAAHFIVSLVVLFMTAYQSAISALVLVQWMSGKHRDNSYIISMWYMSHLSILVVYWVLFIIEFSACMTVRRYYVAICVTTVGIAIQGVFTYFVIATHRYLKATNGF